jgi:von Willebrand factor A domain-containing protein 8
VIALGLPVPEYPGFPLDPPLRSRFQSRYVSAPSFQNQLEHFSKELGQLKTDVPPILLFFEAIERLKYAADGLFAGHKLLPIPANAFFHLCKHLTSFPHQVDTLSRDLLLRVYPFHLFNLDLVQNTTLLNILDSLKILNNASVSSTSASEVEEVLQVPEREKFHLLERSSPEYSFVEVIQSSPSECLISFQKTKSSAPSPLVTLPAVCGSSPTATGSSLFVPVSPHLSTFTSMMQSHALGYDICLVGTKGCGKSVLADHFANTLRYSQPSKIFCYKDMTPRDLLQKRRSPNRLTD